MISRRQFLGSMGALGFMVPTLSLLRRGYADPARPAPNRFLQIYLGGGWDSALGTDPVDGTIKRTIANGGSYANAYSNFSVTNVTGKANLRVGHGLAPAAAGFATIPTAFVNGIYVEVTAHELAQNYMLSGRLSLSNSREYPGMVALMGQASGAFPPHVVMGARVPLAETAQTSPPLQATGYRSLTSLLSGTQRDYFSVQDATRQAAESLVGQLNAIKLASTSDTGKKTLEPWTKAEALLSDFYARRYDNLVKLTDSVKSRYGITDSDDSLALIPSAYLVLTSGMTPFVTVGFGSFDTHSNHIERHVPEMRRFATALNVLISDLLATNDPADSSKKMSETTTVLITSEFVRTPSFNADNGTDHWQSGSVVLLGNGVRDNTVHGGTNAAGNAQGWNGTSTVSFSTESALLPGHFASSTLRKLGYSTQADTIGTSGALNVFT